MPPLTEREMSKATIPPLVLAWLVDYAESIAVDVTPWFNGLGLTIAQIQSPDTLISYRQAAIVLRRALPRLPTTAGLALGTRGGLVSFGILGLAMMSCRTLMDAVTTGVKYHQASGSLMDIGVEDGDADTLVLRLDERFHDPELLVFLCEEILSSTVTFAQLILPGHAIVRRIELGYAAPAHHTAYAALFGCPVVFDSTATRIICNRSVLALPLVTHSPANYAAAIDACDRLLAQHSAGEEDIVVTIQRILRSALPESLPMATVAAELHLTERTLRRKLMNRGESFSTIRDQMRIDEAQRLLLYSRQTVKAIALDLGYGDVRDFRRAFSRLTGQTPQDYRGEAGVGIA